MRTKFGVFEKYFLFYYVLYYSCILIGYLCFTIPKTQEIVPKTIYKHRNLTVDTDRTPEIVLKDDRLDDSDSPEDSLVKIRLSGILNVKRLSNLNDYTTVGIDFGAKQIGVYSPKVSKMIENNGNFWPKLINLLPTTPYQVVVGMPYRNSASNNAVYKSYLTHLPQILTCIDFATTMVNNLYAFYIDKIDLDEALRDCKLTYRCKCQLCLIKRRNRPKIHPKDIECPLAYEIIEIDNLAIPHVYLSSEYLSSKNAYMFSTAISNGNKSLGPSTHCKSAYLIANSFKQNPSNSYFTLGFDNLLPEEYDHRKLYLKSLTKSAKDG